MTGIRNYLRTILYYWGPRVGAGHNGVRIKVSDHVILSRVHPYQYAFKHPLLVCAVEERRCSWMPNPASHL